MDDTTVANKIQEALFAVLDDIINGVDILTSPPKESTAGLGALTSSAVNLYSLLLAEQGKVPGKAMQYVVMGGKGDA